MKDITYSLLYFVIVTAFLCAWFTHLFTCFINESWGFLIAGAVMFPIAIVHGVWLWF